MIPLLDSKGRKISQFSQLARKYNQAQGSIAMAKGCIKLIAFLPGLSTVSKMMLDSTTGRLNDLSENIAIDYQLEKLRLKRDQAKEKVNESCNTK